MKKFTTDWLASKPVFYNEKTLKISHNINDVIDYANIQFHNEGLANFLDFGYSVLGQTPIKNVKFLRYSSEIYVQNGKLKIIELDDPIIGWLEKNSSFKNESDVLEMIENKIQNWEKNTIGNVVLPLSGGYDSRLIAYFLKDKSRIKAFTYGTSKQQEDSSEVILAKTVCELLGIDWKQVQLGKFHQYFDFWDNLYSVSTHAHGMYHIEFYNKIEQILSNKTKFLISGIFGDVWAGSIKFQRISSSKDIVKLGYTHGLHANSKYSLLHKSNDLMEEFFYKNKSSLNDPFFQMINTVRLKMILISYLKVLPEELGFDTFTPYLDMEIALSMLLINPDRRKNRLWQMEFFDKVGLNLDKVKKYGDSRNFLNHHGMRMIQLKPLDISLLEKVVDRNYIENINKLLLKTSLIYKIIPYLKEVQMNPSLLKKLLSLAEISGMKDEVLNAYSAYLTLKPIESVLYKNEKHI